MRAMLVLRPEPGASATARRIEARGFRAIVAPLFTISPIDWTPPSADRFDALMLTSANAVRAVGERLARYRHLPAYAVGAATAAALRDNGIEATFVGAGDAEALAIVLAADGRRAVLHLAGEDHRSVTDGANIIHLPVYRSIGCEQLPRAAALALEDEAVILLHSPRAATLFAALVGEAGIARDTIALAAISPAAAEAAGRGWRAVAIAIQPTDDALLAAAARLCEG